MASAATCDLRVHPVLEQSGGVGMAQIVEPAVAKPESVRPLAESVRHRQWEHRHAGAAVEHVVPVGPRHRAQATLVLGGLVCIRRCCATKTGMATVRRLRRHRLRAAVLIHRGGDADPPLLEEDVVPPSAVAYPSLSPHPAASTAGPSAIEPRNASRMAFVSFTVGMWSCVRSGCGTDEGPGIRLEDAPANRLAEHLRGNGVDRGASSSASSSSCRAHTGDRPASSASRAGGLAAHVIPPVRGFPGGSPAS
jgi:hypothetical protein